MKAAICRKREASHWRGKQFRRNTRCSIVDLTGSVSQRSRSEMPPCQFIHGACNDQYSAAQAFISFSLNSWTAYVVLDVCLWGKRIGRQQASRLNRCRIHRSNMMSAWQ
jgi:hypothetical protein